MSPLLTAREVAELLGVSCETVLRWTRRGDLPAIKLPGGAIRFRPDLLDGWLRERTTPNEEKAPISHDAAQGALCNRVGEIVTHPEGEED